MQMPIDFERTECCPTCSGTGRVSPDLFIAMTARASDPDTSQAARQDSADVRRYTIKSRQYRLLSALSKRPDTAQGAAMRVLGAMASVSSLEGCRRRVSDLARAGHVVDTGQRAANHGSGSDAAIYRVTDEGREVLQRLIITGRSW